MTPSDPFTAYLAPGERIVFRWRPSLRMFLIRLAAVFALTFVILFPTAFLWDLKSWIVASCLLGLAYLFVFDDLTLWGQLRHQEWAISDRSLLAFDGDDELTVIPLHHITDVKIFPPWTVSVDLGGDGQISIICPPAPHKLRQRLLEYPS